MKGLLQSSQEIWEFLTYLCSGLGAGLAAVFFFFKDIIIDLRQENKDLRKNIEDLQFEKEKLKSRVSKIEETKND